MAGVDGILNLVERQGANELRLGTDREPQMLADGAPKRLVIPKTSNETLRELLGELFSREREQQLGEAGQVHFVYEAPGLGAFRVAFTRRSPPGGPLELDVVFKRGKGPPLATPHASAPAELRAPEAAAPAHASPAYVSPAHASPAPDDRVEVASRLDPGSATPALASLVARAAALRASDLHLTDAEPPVVRIDGRLRPLAGEPAVDFERMVGARLGDAARARLAQGTSVDVAWAIEGVGRVRVNVFQSSHGQCAAIRLLRGAAPTLAELDPPVSLQELTSLPHGLVLVCGPTGSGKSSTLAALAQGALEARPAMLVTLEDPIEYTLGGRASRGLVRQRQIGRDVRDFATGLRDALRQDPDILLIGELRDSETVSLALTAAETGHLVLASLHSRSAVGAIERIVDACPAERQAQTRLQLADSLRAVVAQRLLPRANGEGRVLALELLRVSHGVAAAIREGKPSVVQSAMQSGKKEGMLPLERCLSDLVHKRLITVEDARAVANDLGALASYLAG